MKAMVIIHLHIIHHKKAETSILLEIHSLVSIWLI